MPNYQVKWCTLPGIQLTEVSKYAIVESTCGVCLYFVLLTVPAAVTVVLLIAVLVAVLLGDEAPLPNDALVPREGAAEVDAVQKVSRPAALQLLVTMTAVGHLSPP